MLLDWRGYVAEATGANVFFVQDGRVITPPADGAILNGITRQTVLEMLAGRGIEVEVRHILPEELAGFSECFLCGTAAEITPVSEIGDHRFIPGDLSLGLMDEYSRLVRGQL
jgi:branched-chain amino acid aminotransferase